MAPLNRVIIDTDPGVDDIWALLLAFAAKSEELEVLLISTTFGNVEVRSCLRNVVALFNILDQEIKWRRDQGKAEGFDGLRSKPTVAVGAEGPLDEQLIIAAYFHGRDGLAGIHASHPHLSPEDTWKKLFEKPPEGTVISESAPESVPSAGNRSFTPSLEPAHKEILRLLRENEPDTITIVAVGPLTNLALAASEDPETFLRVKEVVSMGGAIDLDGNATPVAEFNVLADSVAAARVYALTGPNPSSTMPPDPPRSKSSQKTSSLPAYPIQLSKQLKLTLFSLDITESHVLSRGAFNAKAIPLAEAGSPLAEWLMAFTTATLNNMEYLHEGHGGDNTTLAMHDSLCVWYLLTQNSPSWHLSPKSPEDIRVEVSGQWTRGMTVVDRRTRKRRNSSGEVPHDTGDWLGRDSGNRVYRMIASPGEDKYADYLLSKILGD